jgi:nucleoside-diphosphate-sugar epimerase
MPEKPHAGPVAKADTTDFGGTTMRVFVTGATGFIGSAVVSELIDAGHEVVGLTRSDEGAAVVRAAGAQPLRGTLEDLDTLGGAAAAADGVIHTAYNHDFSRMEEAAQMDLRAIESLGTALEGSDRPLVITTGTALIKPGSVVTENDAIDPATAAHPRAGAEPMAKAFATRGVRSSIVRPGASVHGEGDHGFVPVLIGIARDKGASAYIGDGSNRWPAVHRLDAAHLYRLALENGPAGSVFHAVGDEGVPTREIAEIIGRHLGVPTVSIAAEDAADHFGWMGAFFSLDAPASSALTQERLGWRPTHIGLVEDLEQGHYFQSARVAVA